MSPAAFKRITILGSLLLVVLSELSAQPLYPSLNYQIRAINSYALDDSSHQRQTLSSCFLPSENSRTTGRPLYRNYLPPDFSDSSMFAFRKFKHRSWMVRKLFFENFFYVDTNRFLLTVDPLLNVSLGQEELEIGNSQNNSNYSRKIYSNTRGFRISAIIGNNLGVETYFSENQSYLPYYLDTFVVNHGVVPGQGRVKKFKDRGYDYSQSGGYVYYTFSPHLNVQAGHHKHFIGYGYRSLMLSDNSFNYPFVRVNLNAWQNRISYSVLYTSFQNLNRLPTGTGSESPFERKGGTYHVLEIGLAKKLKFSIYQGMIWTTQDSAGRRKTDYNMYNPIMFVNPAVYGMEDENNAILGSGLKFMPVRGSSVYGTFVADGGYFKNRYAYQIGAYTYVFKKVRIQSEYNRVAPYTYNLLDISGSQSFSHYNQPLAHPSGAGFSEFLVQIHGMHRRWIGELKWIWSSSLYDPSVLNTSTLIPDENQNLNTYSQVKGKSYVFGELAFLVNPATNLKVFMNYLHRLEQKFGSPGNRNSNNLVYVGIRTDLSNFYYDF